MNGFRTIMGKEFARVFKDKKLIFSMFILPVIIMAGIFLLMFGLISNMKADIDKHISEVRLIRLSLAELDARPRRAAKPDQIRKCLHDQRDGKYDPKRGQRVHAGAFDPRDVHSVDDII